MAITPFTRSVPIVPPSRTNPVLLSWVQAQPGSDLEKHPHYRDIAQVFCRRGEGDYNYLSGGTLYTTSEMTPANIASRAGEFFAYQGFTIAGLRPLGSAFLGLPLTLYGLGQRWTEPGRILDHPSDRLGADPANPHLSYSPVCAAAIAETAADCTVIAAAIVAEFAAQGLRLPDLLVTDLEYQSPLYYGAVAHDWTAEAPGQPYGPYTALGAPVYAAANYPVGWLETILALAVGHAARTQPIYEDYVSGAWVARSFNDWWAAIGSPAYASALDISHANNATVAAAVTILQYTNLEYRWRKGIAEPFIAAFGSGLRVLNYSFASSAVATPYQLYHRARIHADFSSPPVYPASYTAANRTLYQNVAENTAREIAVLSWRKRCARVGTGPNGLVPWIAERDGFTGMGYVTSEQETTDALCAAQRNGADLMAMFRSKDLGGIPTGLKLRAAGDDASLLASLGEVINFSRRSRALPGDL